MATFAAPHLAGSGSGFVRHAIVESHARHSVVATSSAIYYNADGVSIQPVSAWQGIRSAGGTGPYLITGTSNNHGLLYVGPISGVGGTSYSVDYPSAVSTSVYGPDYVSANRVRLVGSYRSGDGAVHGFLFEGTTADLSGSAGYRTIDYPHAQYTYVHSTMGNLAVGNADGPEGNAPLGTGHAFLYDVSGSRFLSNIVYPGSTTTTAYGIWYNGGTSYTICGGYTKVVNGNTTVSRGYLVDYDSATGKFSNWTPFEFQNGAMGEGYYTHFEGISSAKPGVYTLSADSGLIGSDNPEQGSFVTVRRNSNGTFGSAAWVDLNYPGVPGPLSANSVAGNQVVGIVISRSGVFSYQATVKAQF
ncbi:MAG: hypothetical protein P4L84_13190 [Isosphaeraceae bacterium]|nr:hypothetical protein [Isosphaeraceae bacterium]